MLADALADQRFHKIAAANGHSRLVDHHAAARGVHGGANAASGRFQVAQIGLAARQRRSSHGDKHHVAGGDGGLELCREVDATAARGQSQQLREAGFVNRNIAALQSSDLFSIHVDAGDVVAEVGEADSCDRADVSSADYGDAHYPAESPI